MAAFCLPSSRSPAKSAWRTGSVCLPIADMANMVFNRIPPTTAQTSNPRESRTSAISSRTAIENISMTAKAINAPNNRSRRGCPRAIRSSKNEMTLPIQTTGCREFGGSPMKRSMSRAMMIVRSA